MKRSAIQVFLALLTTGLGLARPTAAQGLLDRRITLHLEAAPLRTALAEIGQVADVKFTYNSRLLPTGRRVSVEVRDERLEAVLDRVLRPLGIGYTVVSRQIILKALPTLPQSGFLDQQPEEIPDVTVSGRVTDQAGAGLPAVNVAVKGTTRGTTTDGEGRYRLAVPDGSAVLVFSSVGYEKVEVAVGNQTIIDVVMKADVKSLNEVVVVGYGAVKRSDLTGAVASVGEKDIKATPIVALDRAMQGRAAGVQVTSNSARPGGGVTVRIRGTGSVNATNEPLYVIDGYPTGDLNSINPNDIESIEILKDASATAIYGSRGSNGVVLVTTKRGVAGQSAVSFESYYGVQQARRVIPLLNAREYAEFVNEARINGGGTAYFDGSSPDRPLPSSFGEGTDWQRQVLRQAPIQNYQLTFSGGESKTRYAISGSYFEQQGIVINSGFKRYTLRANLDRAVSSRVSIGLSMQGAYTRANNARTETEGGTNAGVTAAALNYLPIFPAYNPDGSYFKDNTTLSPFPIDSPVALANEITDLTHTTRLLSNVYADVKLLEGLTFRTTWGADLLNNRNDFYATRKLLFLGANGGSGSVSSAMTMNWLNENTLTYTRAFAQKHTLTGLLGYTAQGFRFETATARGATFNDDFALYNNLGAGATLTAPSSGAAEWALVSYLARINYGFDDRVLLTLTARRDGSSRFGPNNKYGFFPSGAVAWKLINEKFLQKQTLLSDLKARVSYGLTGNQGISDYAYLSAIAVAPYAFGGPTAALVNGGVPSGVSNSELRWEKNAQFDAGLDLALLNNRVRLTADYYVKTTSDLLFNVNIPLSTGYATSLRNIGKVENRGWEFALGTVNIDTKGFRWTSDFNIAFNRNKVLTLDGRSEFTSGDGSPNLNVFNPILMKVGQPLGNFYGRVVEGIFQNQAEVDGSAQKTAKPGDFRFADLNGDGKIDDNDRTIIGNGYPKFFGGLNNTLTYKGFELNVFVQGTYGNDILNWGRFEQYSLNGQNQAREVTNRWTPTNPSTTIPRANSAGGQRILSSFHVEDGSYLRVKNISLGYTLPEGLLRRVFVRSAKVYVAAQNWLTFTRYKGYDPEVSRQGTASISQGMDYGAYPTAKTVLAGLNLHF